MQFHNTSSQQIPHHTDILVIGGGINGTAIALDAANRGLNVVLCEQNDLASATSSASSKLIHGGIRYLEQYEFRLVKEALTEREILLHKAPHLVRPLSFIMPDNPSIRSPWLIRIGLFLYDHLAKHKHLPPSSRINLSATPFNEILKPEYTKGFQYTDCWADDARLVIHNAMAAHKLGATILTYTHFEQAKRKDGQWHATLFCKETKQPLNITAKAIVNAAGPWADDILNDKTQLDQKRHIQWIKGSHIITKAIHQENTVLILQHDDNRVIFILPYLSKYSLIGTTDILYEGDISHIAISNDEIEYLCNAVSEYLKRPITPNDVLDSYSGVRSLPYHGNEKPQEMSRDYYLDLKDENGSAPLLSVLGGKITTHRPLAKATLDMLGKYFTFKKFTDTSKLCLPGGDFFDEDITDFLVRLRTSFPFISPTTLERYVRQFGTLTTQLLTDVKTINDLGEHLGASLYTLELQYLLQYEFAKTVDDIIWRRTKLGYELSPQEQHKIQLQIDNIKIASNKTMTKNTT